MKITVYEKDHCAKCMWTERTLTSMKLPFETKNILDEENIAMYRWAKENGKLALPLVFVDDQFAWNDMRVDKLEELEDMKND
jgi:glutaredoxin